MKKLYSFLLILVVLASAFTTACKTTQVEDDDEDDFKIYYTDDTGINLQGVSSDISGLSEENHVGGILEIMRRGDERYTSPFPYEVRVIDYSLSKKKLMVNFNAAYSNMDRVTEILLRSSIVLTMTQLEEVDYVTFKVNGEELKNRYGQPVGVMTASDIVSKVGVSINQYDSVVSTLYFANFAGTGLKAEVRSNVYDSSKQLERNVVEQLLKGPGEKGDYKVFPEGTKLLDIYTNDDICYVDFNSKLIDGPATVNDEVLIYAIVNSLTELSYINKVQISVEGDVDVKLHNKISLNTLFSRDLSYME